MSYLGLLTNAPCSWRAVPRPTSPKTRGPKDCRCFIECPTSGTSAQPTWHLNAKYLSAKDKATHSLCSIKNESIRGKVPLLEHIPPVPLDPSTFLLRTQETEGLCVSRTLLPGVPTPSSYAGCSLHLWHDIHKLISPSRPLLGLVFTEYSMKTFPCVSRSVVSNSLRPRGL